MRPGVQRGREDVADNADNRKAVDDAAEENVAISFERHPVRVIPDVMTVKAEKQVYTVSKSTQIWITAFDNDGDVFPVLLGTRFYGYDTSVIRIVGGLMVPVGEGTTRVFLNWHGLNGDFLVHVTDVDS